MSCAPFDLRDYFFEELGREERRQVEAHVGSCAHCREELEQLRGTQQALLHLKDEEMPRRIAFVSDKVFEPSGAWRWWAAVASRVPRFAFSLALLLAVFFAGAWASRPSITVGQGRWQVAFGGGDARVEQKLAAIQARHETEMRDVRDAFELMSKEMNMLYRQSGEARPAALRQ